MSSVRVRVPAKINLSLSVGPVSEDGYHRLATVFQAVSIYDEVVVSGSPRHSSAAAPRAGEPQPANRRADLQGSDSGGVEITGEYAGNVPTDGSNLAWQAVESLAKRLDKDPDVAVSITKAIPVAGGMAGGSADAAAALLGCARLWGEGSPELLNEVAAEIGSDVPFALLGGTAVGVGRGDVLTPAMVRGRYHWVFALAQGGLSTPKVYQRCDELRGPGFTESAALDPDLMLALRAGDSEALGRSLSNDLQPAALSLMPLLQDVLEVGVEHGALGGIVSGSGPTCGFLVAGDEQALDLGVALSASGLCAGVRRGEGPVSGATVVAVS